MSEAVAAYGSRRLHDNVCVLCLAEKLQQWRAIAGLGSHTLQRCEPELCTDHRSNVEQAATWRRQLL